MNTSAQPRALLLALPVLPWLAGSGADSVTCPLRRSGKVGRVLPLLLASTGMSQGSGGGRLHPQGAAPAAGAEEVFPKQRPRLSDQPLPCASSSLTSSLPACQMASEPAAGQTAQPSLQNLLMSPMAALGPPKRL